MTDILSLLGASEPEETKEAVPAPSEPATPSEKDTPIVVKNPLPEETYTCPKCGKVYKAIFLMKPVSYDCTKCFYGTPRRT